MKKKLYKMKKFCKEYLALQNLKKKSYLPLESLNEGNYALKIDGGRQT